MKKLLIFAAFFLVAGLSAAQANGKHDILQNLIHGNNRFLAGNLKSYDYQEQMRANKRGQSPETLVLGCMDSRSIPELAFNQGIGHMFNIGIAGNIVNKDILGSIEYAVKVVKTKMIVVLGHTDCGAVKGACDKVRFGHIGQIVGKIAPAVEQARAKNPEGQCNDPKFIDEIARLNVINVVNEIKRRSSIVAKQIRKGKVQIIGAMYDVKTGKVNFAINQ